MEAQRLEFARLEQAIEDTAAAVHAEMKTKVYEMMSTQVDVYRYLHS